MHIPRDEVSRMGNRIPTDANIPLLDQLDALHVHEQDGAEKQGTRTALTVSTILDMHITLASRRGQKATTVFLLSAS